MKLIIAEKPDQGSTLASIFKHKRQNGFIEIFPNELFPDGGYVTWAIGHICQLVQPEKYQPEWKKWSLTNLPIMPEQFNYEVTKDKAKQFAVIKKLVSDPQVTEIIHAGDAGREGELIIRNILRLTNCRKPMKRLWISSLTPNSIREGFKKLLEETDTRNLYFEAYTRACADWVVGMNASRLYSLLLQKQGFSDVFSVGRVQTPTLALIVKRELEIENFKSEPFWEVMAQFLINDKKYMGKWQNDGETRVNTKEMAEKVAAFCRGKNAEVDDVQCERKEFLPPLLYNLSALQADANKRYKFSPKKTLDVLQQLYQKGYVSYPRSDSRYVTKEEAANFPDILNKISHLKDYQGFFPLPVDSIAENKRYVNEKKVTDHYAIIPTEQIPNIEKLSADEQKLYDLVVRSLIAAHYHKAVFEYTTVITMVDGRAKFVSKGKVQIEEGFRKVINHKDQDDEPSLPLLAKGEQGKTVKVDVKESQTQPPKRYTEGQLITLMKSAGKHIEDKELEKILTKTEGLGTEATRAGIITMLKDRAYIEVRKNMVYATAKAKILIEAIGKEILASPEMTAKWEQKLKEISEGAASPKQFMEHTKKMVHHLITTGVGQAANWTFSEELTENFTPGKRASKKAPTKLGTCKKCDGSIVDKGSFYGCSNYQKNKCNFTISKKILGKNITQKNIKLLLTEGKTEVIEGFSSNEKTFNARLYLDEQENRVKFLFETQPSKVR
ncbi:MULTISPECIES: DNA topoisomerase III [Neobacillus]|uniref:DNA topoisomerase n=1 Tax=Neobacillus rhizophilus TaxID=2833579 RepID=A0A942UBK3_9BACI|nr:MULTISPECIES: DNA topoisomerase III [Neobacillus]MBS4215936.1 DNA topoisomerase III [Neobacillus rhizophilus]MBU8916167.1 DNA topoisomerase III [Bacillus sp. FJAT-29953]